MLGEQTLLSFEQSNVKMLHYGTKKQLCMGKLRLRLKQGLNKVGGVLLGTNSRGSKKYLRVDGDEEDDLITSFVVALKYILKMPQVKMWT